MKKKSLSLILLSLLLLAGLVPTSSSHGGTEKVDYPADPTHLVVDTIAEPISLDPAWAYDTVSTEVVMNVYETLVFFDRDYTLGAPAHRGPYEAGLVGSFSPMLANEVLMEYISETSPEGLTWVKRFTFRIRENVLFHDMMTVLTPEDVEYSFERLLVQDRDGGPAWMLYEPLLHVYRAADPFTDPLWGLKIDHAVENNATHVWFNLVKDYPELAFMQILSQSWSSVVNRAWCIAHGDLDVDSVIGGWSNWQEIYDWWHNPDVSPINEIMMGTGPYMFYYWEGGVSWSVVKHDGYWQGWPAPVTVGSGERIGGFITTVTWNYFPTWATRTATFLGGDTDMSYVPRRWRGAVLGTPGIHCYYPLDMLAFYTLEMLALDAFFFTFDIDDTTMYAGGPGGHGYPSGEFHQDGIPRNLFGIDPDTGVDEGLIVRMGFAYAFNYLEYLDSAYLGEGSQPADPVIEGLAYNRPADIEDETWEKHNELMVNGEYDAGESIYFDADNSFTVSAADVLLAGPVLPAGTPLISFGIVLATDEKHAENVAGDGWYNNGESIYRDLDHDGTASVGDVLVSGPAQPLGTTLVSYVGKWKYVYNPSLAAYFLQLAWGGVDANGNGIIDPTNEPGDVNGNLWTSGMSFTIVYNDGNDARMLSANMIATNINGLNPLFGLTVMGVHWAIYEPLMVAGVFPLFMFGWTADFTDPHDFVHPFMHSQGTFASAQGYANYLVDIWIEEGIQTDDGEPREAIYFNLQEDYFFDVPSVPLVQPVGRHWERDWVRGWYYNPLYGGSLTPGIDSTAPATPTLYVYHLWKAVTHMGDANNDGDVNIADSGVVSAHWTAAGRPYNPKADLSGGMGGTTGSAWGPVRGIPDGIIDMVDRGMVSAYWDGPPIWGPAHP